MNTRCHLPPVTRILLLATLLASAPALADAQRHVILVDGNKVAGEQVVETDASGLTRVRFIFKDNGRGPELQEEYRLRADGSFADYRVTGSSTFGAEIDERFSREGDRASWTSTSESGEQQVEGDPLYIPLNGSPQVMTVAIAAMAARGETSLPLLPGGRLQQRVAREVDVTSDGVSRTVQLLVHTGLGLTPQLSWAGTGDDPGLFAFIVPGYLAAIEEGWENNVEKLTTVQQEVEAGLVRDLAQRQFRSLNGLTVVRNARIFDSPTGTVGEPSDVYLLRDRITAVLPAGSPSSDPQNEIDAGGRVMLPGLFDMHGHEFGRWNGGLHLAAGVTTVRDMGNDNATLQSLIDETARGEILSPRIIPAGFLEGESEFSARNGFVVGNLDEARDAIDWYHQHGYPQLKIYNSFPHGILEETVAYAHSRGLRVSGHVPVRLRAQDVVDAGFDEIQHINQLMLNFMVTPETDTRTLERFRLPAHETADLDFGSPEVRAFIASLKENDVAIDPTLATFDFLRQRPGQVSAAYAAIVDHLPLELQRQFKVGQMDIPDDATAERYDQSYRKMIEFTGLLHEAGIVVVPGTDALAGFTLHRELELFVQAGMTPAEALQSATSVSARLMGVDHERGHIAEGKLADLVLVDGDPLQDISAIRKVALVLTQGRLVSPSAVYSELGIKPFTEREPTLQVRAASMLGD